MQETGKPENGIANKGISRLHNEICKLETSTYSSSNLAISITNCDMFKTDINASCSSIKKSDIFDFDTNESPQSLKRRFSGLQMSIDDINKNEENDSTDCDNDENGPGNVKNEENGPTNLPGIKGELEKDTVTYNKRLFKCMDIAEGCNSMNSKRLVNKEGMVDIKYVNMPGIKTRFMRDLFHTLMDARWRYNILLFTLSFIISWVIFGTLWYIIVHFRTINCVDNVDSWVTAFLFSIETQTTIGYGGRALTADCPEGVILLAVQTVIGMFISCFQLGLMFGKLARPKNRGKTTMFSKNAVITVRDGYFCLVFRYADLCRRILLDSNMRMVIIRPRLTEEGEFLPLDMADLSLTIDYEQVEYTMRLFPLFPVTVIHIIDDESPLYNMSKRNLRNTEFELIAILEGTVPTTGNTTQALASYRPDEILWAHRFKPVSLGGGGGGHESRMNAVDLHTIHDTYEENITPDYSAEEFLKMQEEEGDSSSSASSESHGYQIGESPPISSVIDVAKLSQDNSIDIDKDSIQDLFQLKETEA